MRNAALGPKRRRLGSAFDWPSPPTCIQGLKRPTSNGTGPLDAARDGQQIAGVLAEHAADFAGKHPFTKAQLDKLREDADWLVPALRPVSAKIAPTERDPAAILRDQLGAMLIDRYELARQAGGVLFGLRDLDARIPPLGARIGSARSSTPESPAPTPESPAPAAPANG